MLHVTDKHIKVNDFRGLKVEIYFALPLTHNPNKETLSHLKILQCQIRGAMFLCNVPIFIEVNWELTLSYQMGYHIDKGVLLSVNQNY